MSLKENAVNETDRERAAGRPGVPANAPGTLPSTNKTNEILSASGAAGRITRLPPTHSRLPAISRTRGGGGGYGSEQGRGVDK